MISEYPFKYMAPLLTFVPGIGVLRRFAQYDHKHEQHAAVVAKCARKKRLNARFRAFHYFIWLYMSGGYKYAEK